MLFYSAACQNPTYEIGFSIAPVQTKDIDLNISMNLSLQKNKMLSLSGNYNGMNMSAANSTRMCQTIGLNVATISTLSISP